MWAGHPVVRGFTHGGPLRRAVGCSGDTPEMPSYYRDRSAPAPNRPRLVGVVALIELDGSVLVDRRSDDGAWAFVGGRVEEDESVLDALHREVHESVAFVVVPQPGAAPRTSDESLELRLVARDDLAALPLWPAATPVRDAYLAFDGTPVIA